MTASDLDVPAKTAKPAPRRSCNCAFCGSGLDTVELMFRSAIGGEPPFICDACVQAFQEIVEAHRRSPADAVALISALSCQ